MREIKKIIVHCSATPEGRDTKVWEIDKWHKERGFSSVGYHYVVYLDGSVHKGRPDAAVGAHCQGHNSDSIGVCYVGGLDKSGKKSKDTRTEAQKQSLVKLLRILKERYPKAAVYGHRDFTDKKDCPCFDARIEYANL